jgi:hypothetical protein
MRSGRCRVLALVFFVLLASRGNAAAPQGRAAVMVLAGMTFPVQKTIEARAVTGFGLLLPLAPRTRAGVHFLYARLNSLGSDDGLGEGNLALTPFLLFLQYDLVSTKFFKFHLAAGAGLVFSDFRGRFITIPEVTITQKIPTRPAVHLAAGVTIPLSDRLVLFGQGGALFCQATGQTIIRDMNIGQSTENFSVNLGSRQVVLGLAFYF